MADFKLTISNPKTGKSFKRDVTGKEADNLLGKDIGEPVSGDLIGFPGYEFAITGGSDLAGFPMRRGIQGFARKRITMYEGVGFSGLSRKGRRQQGLRRKRTVVGKKVSPKITQVNLKVTKEGSTDLFAEKKEEAPPAEAAKEAAPQKQEKPAEAQA